MYASQRTLRLADGPDEVHQHVVGRAEAKSRESDNADRTASYGHLGAGFSGP